FKVTANDLGTPTSLPASVPATVVVNVNRNLNPPVITNTQFTHEIFQNLSTNGQVFDVEATDQDTVAPFNTLTFDLLGDDNAPVFFDIDASSGVVTLKNSLQLLPTTEYQLRVRVRDGGNPRKEDVKVFTVTIKRNFHQPTFNTIAYAQVIPENLAVDSSVINIQAFDSDFAAPYNTLRYYFTTSPSRFLLNPETGLVTVRRSLLGETQVTFLFFVYAEDMAEPPLRSINIPLNITIVRNDHSPVFTNLPNSLRLDADNNIPDTIFTAIATDADTIPPFNTITYSIIGDDRAENLFIVDSTGGQVILTGDLSTFPEEYLKIRLVASDGGSPSKTDTNILYVNITRNLNSPSFAVASYNADILETEPLARSIQKVTAIDADTVPPNNNIMYSVVGNAKGSEYFMVDENSGTIFVKKDLRDDPDKDGLYTVIVAASDRGVPSRPAANNATVFVTVHRNLNAPTFGNPNAIVNVNRNVVDNQNLDNIVVTDSDTRAPFNTFSVSMIGDGIATSLFYLDLNSIKVKSAADLQADSEETYTLRLYAEDGGSPPLTSTAVVTVNIVRNLLRPTFDQALYNVTILETTGTGVNIFTVSATDNDPPTANNRIEYELTGDSTATQYFYVNPSSGEVSLLQSIVGTGVSPFRLTITANDNGNPPLSTSATGFVYVETDPTLQFSLPSYTRTISENTALQAFVVGVLANPGPGIVYSITGQSDAPDFFEIDSTSGVITLKQLLTNDVIKRQQFTVKVMATKVFPNGQQTATADVIIVITRNENPPIFNQSLYTAAVSDQIQLGSVVVQLYATDQDSQDVLSYSMVNPTSVISDLFYLGPATGTIRLKNLLSSNNLAEFNFVVRVSDQSNPEKTDDANVQITVSRNNLSPAFVSPPFSTGINFDQSLGNSFYTVQANDNDLKGTMTYAITGYYSGPQFFEIGPTSGSISLFSSIEQDTSSSYTLGLIAYDSLYPADTASTNITISINRNPNGPSFTRSSYIREISEEYAVGISLIQLEASDADGHALTYTISSATSDGNDFFQVDQYTGLVTVKKPLTESVSNNYQITFSIRDDGSPSNFGTNFATGSISILRNLNSPLFAGNYLRSVNENATIGTSIVRVLATDGDTNPPEFGRVTYSLIGDDNFGSLFRLNSTTGEITTISALNLVNVPSYQGRVVANDGGSPPRSATALIVIEVNRNLHRPIIPSSTYSQGTLETHGIDVIAIPATDADTFAPFNTITFDMTEVSGTSLTYFQIDQSSGIISVRTPLYLDSSDNRNYIMQVTARDGGDPSLQSVTTATVTITVQRNVNRPVCLGEPYSTSISYRTLAGATVFPGVNVTDADTNVQFNTITYSIVGDLDAQTLFQINSDGLISARLPLSAATLNEYKVQVQAVDGGFPQQYTICTVSVTITRNLIIPRFTTFDATITILESQSLGVNIYNFPALDTDEQSPYNEMSFILAGDADINTYFAVNEPGDNLYVKSSLVDQPKDTFTAVVTVTDGGGFVGQNTLTLTINILRNDFTPYFTSDSYVADLQQSVQVGDLLFTVTGADSDSVKPPLASPYYTLKYSILGDDDAPSFFDIGESSGQVTVKSVLTSTSSTEFNLRIQVSDQGQPPRTNTTLARVAVRNNFQRPLFNETSYYRRIKETNVLGETILRVYAPDQDLLAPNNVVEYSITAGPEDQQCFFINSVTGDIALRQSLLTSSCQTINKFEMTVQAKDQGTPSFDSSVLVTIDVDRNQNPPVFDNLPFEITPGISESINAGDVVYDVDASDADFVAPFNTITYTLIGDDTGPQYFSIDSSTGVVTVRQQILNTQETSYRLRIVAEDGGSPAKFAQSTLLINVRRNLRNPVFASTSYEVTILETHPYGNIVETVNATDSDSKAPHNQLTYTITSSSLAQQYFQINSQGQITIQRSLIDDTADTSIYILTVMAQDQGVPPLSSLASATVRVNVIRNENCPVFQNTQKSVDISQSRAAQIILDVNATDADSSAEFSRIEYRLIGDAPATSFFAINEVSGAVTTNVNLYNDNGIVYQLRVLARDGGTPPCEITDVYIVNVNRNLNTPVWVNTQSPNYYEFTILETQPVSVPFSTVSATDSDEKAPHNEVTYEFTTNTDIFRVDANGQVFLRSSLILGTVEQYTIKMLAYDKGTPTRSSSVEGTLVVNVVRNKYTPEFIDLPNVISVNQNVTTSTVVYTIGSRDNDTNSPFNQIEYRVLGDSAAPSYFNVLSPSGQVIVSNSIDTDTTNVYLLRVRILDGGTPQKFADEVLTIVVNRNLNRPVFSNRFVQKQILEIQNVGIPITSVSATDADNISPNGDVRYFLDTSDPNIDSYFSVDSVTGQVMLKKQMIDYPNSNEDFNLVFQVNARDMGSTSQTALIPATVEINVVRNTQPLFDQKPYSETLGQFDPPNTFVYRPVVINRDTIDPFNRLNFSLIGDDSALLYFAVDPNNGVVRTTRNLTESTALTFTVRIKVQDNGIPPLEDTATVRVSVERNERDPSFLHSTSLNVNIPENLPVGSFVADINATDADAFAPNNLLQYVITGGTNNGQQFFFIDQQSGIVYLTQSVASGASNFQLTIVAMDQGVPIKQAQATLNVNVLRSTGNLMFSLPEYNATISENIGVNNFVTRVIASPGVSIQYSLTGRDPGPTYFSVDTNNGDIRIKSDLRTDSSRLTHYILLVRAVSFDVTTQTASTTVNIFVTRNEFSPVFDPQSAYYETSIEEKMELGSTVLQVVASDQDNDQIKYSIVDGTPYTTFFFLNADTGVITLQGLLTTTNVGNFSFNVQASDQGNPEKISLARVHIIIMRDAFRPVFRATPYNANTNEDAVDNFVFYRNILATDDDLRGQILYEVIQDNIAATFFSINRTSAFLSIQNQNLLLNDVQQNYQLRVIAYDSVYPENPATATVSVFVSRNSNAPVFIDTPYSRTVYDHIPLGTRIVDINATDANGDEIRYAMTGNSRALEYYYLNPVTGLITLKKLLTEGTQLTDTVTIDACDQRSPQRCVSVTATININRDNFPPVYTRNNYGRQISQVAPVGELIDTVEATDQDLEGKINYVVDGNYPAPSFFTVGLESGRVTVSQMVNMDSLQTDTYELRIAAYDTFYPDNRVYTIVTIPVNRNPAAPNFSQEFYRKTIAETFPLGTSVVQLNATDADNDQLRFYMDVAADQQNKDYFYVNPENGLISLRQILTTSSFNQFTFSVVVRDVGNKEDTATVIIAVERDDQPNFINLPETRNIQETNSLTQSIFTVAASDTDMQGQMVYNIIGEFNSPKFFRVNNATGEVFVQLDLKLDIVEQYKVIFTAYDSGSPGKTATGTLTVNVEHNINQPVVNSAVVSIWEYTAVGTNILNITATDGDGDTLRYELLSTGTLQSDRALMYFSINPDTGYITVTKPLESDVDRPGLYQMNVRVRDQRYPFEKSGQALVEINVQRNRNSPVFQNTPYNQPGINENSAISTSIITVTARDSDMQGYMVYEVVGENSAPFYFNVDSRTGNVTIKNNLKYETNTVYLLVVEAYDSQYPTDRATATVTIGIVRNLFSPVFNEQSYAVTINESIAIGVSILQVLAADQDNDTMTYAALPSQADTFFYLAPSTGVLTIRSSLMDDPIRRLSFQMNVQATDDRSPQRTTAVGVSITVLRDLFSPNFDPADKRYTVTIPETTQVLDPVRTVRATDNDRIGTIKYEAIGNYPAPSFFSVNEDNGQITLQKSLLTPDAVLYNQFMYLVVAYDSARPDKQDTATVEITITRNTNPPIWTLPAYGASIREDHDPFSSVIDVVATDNDNHDTISYEIVDEKIQRTLDQGAADYFYIDTETGRMYLRKSVLSTDISRFVLVVRACDTGTPVRCANTTVTIDINRLGVPPRFRNSTYKATIPEDKAVDSSVLMVSAIDSNILGQVVYEVEVPGSAFFSLNSTSGEITLAKSVFNELDITYRFRVITYDTGEPQYRSTADVMVTVVRNAFKPTFLLRDYIVVVDQKSDFGVMVVNTTAVDRNGDVPVYRMTGTPVGLEYFRIDRDTGEIFLNKLLSDTPFIQYNFTVYARDQRRVNEKTDFANVIINIDLDDQPVYLRTPYEAFLLESRAVNTSVYLTTAQDSDLTGTLVREITGVYPAQDFFAMNSSSGEVTLIRDLREDPRNLALYMLELKVYDSQYPSNTGTTFLRVSVSRNPNAPQFNNTNYYKQLNELVSISTSVMSIGATDNDPLDVVTYKIISADNNGDQFFLLDPSTGLLTTKKLLTEANFNRTVMIIEASDQRGQTNTVQMIVEIIRNPADKAPYFIGEPYEATIFFTQDLVTEVDSVVARDDDLVAPSRIVYEIVGIFPAPDHFRIDDTTGQIFVSQDLSTDVYKTLVYTLRVEAYDMANPDLRAETNVIIRVIRNPAQPRFTNSAQYTITIPETYGPGAIVMPVTAIDDDGDVVRYNIVNDTFGFEAMKFFFINGETGVISVIGDLKSSAPVTQYAFNVRARDQGTPEKFGSATVVISITRDSSDPAFLFPKNYTRTIFETVPVNDTQSFYRFTASDGNLQESLRYAVTGDGLAMAYFWVDTNGGVYVRKDLMTTDEVNFVMTVAVYDTYYPNNRDYAVLNIIVIRNPGEPVFSFNGQYDQTINEYHQFGKSVIGVSASDSDGDVLRYKILGPSEATQKFYITPDTGVVYLYSRPDPVNYVMTIEASDQRTPPKTKNATLRVNVIANQPPRFRNIPAVINVAERSEVNVRLFQVSATDSDLVETGGTLQYKLIGDGAGPSFFQLSSEGVISPRVNLRGDNALIYELRVQVYDSEIPSMAINSTVTVNMTRNPNQPVFTLSGFYTFPITDNTPIGDRVGSVLATDADNDTIRYSVLSGPEDYFYLLPDSGEMFLIKPLSTTGLKRFIFTVRASDQRLPEKSAIAQVTIQVDRDEQAPVFADSTHETTIDETDPLNFIVYTATATDNDLRGNITYEITGNYPAQTFFGILQDGNILITRSLKEDGLARTSYVLTIEAYDSANPDLRGTMYLTINVRRNINGPVFDRTDYSTVKSELTPMGVLIFNITATDNDGDEVVYDLIGDKQPNGQSLKYFIIERTTGYMYLREPLTSSTVPSFSMVVRATDNGNPPRTQEVDANVFVQRITAPIFSLSEYDVNLKENVGTGYSVVTVSAAHQPVLPQADIRYMITGIPPATHFFSVNSTTGQISVSQDLRGDRTAVYQLTLRAYDNANPSVYSDGLVVITMERNPNSPSFSQASYTASIQEDDPLGTSVTQIMANDADNDTLTYSLTGNTRCLEAFYIVSSTGIVYLKENQELTSDLQYICQVTVTDNGYPNEKTANTQLVIGVVRGQLPSFSLPTYQANALENDNVGKLLTTVSATRIPTLGEIMYETVGDYPAQSFFGVNNKSGEVTIIRDLRQDGLNLLSYTLKVVAYDTGKPSLRRTGTVVIDVARNLNGPTFYPINQQVELPQSTNPDFWSLALNVTDPDSPTLTCSIISDVKAQEFFMVDKDCRLSLKKSLLTDPDVTQIYTVRIEASDNGVPSPKTARSTVTVIVPRDLSNPAFTNLPDTININEDSTPGTSVFDVTASDQDRRGNLTYNLVGVFPAQTFFKMDPLTGEITILNVPKSDSQENMEYKLRVEVYDSYWPNNKAYGELTVRINRNPTGPVFNPRRYVEVVRANVELGTVLFQLSASDADGDRLIYTSDMSAQDMQYLTLSRDSGAIILYKSLETVGTPNSFNFNVFVFDTRNPVRNDTTTVFLSVTALAGPPIFTENNYEVTIPITQSINTTATAVIASDSDLQGSLRYEVKGFAPGTEYFRLDSTTGVIYVNKDLHLNTNLFPNYFLLIEAFDTSEPEAVSRATVTIKINRNVFGPSILPSTYTAFANDYDPKGTPILDINATDSDTTMPENNLFYTLEDGRAANDYFTISPFTGLISVSNLISSDPARPLDYVLRVIVRDTSATPKSATATVTININRNDPPSFVSPFGYEVEISEAIPIFSNIITVSATDPDPPTSFNSKLSYYFVGPEEASKRFQINSTTGSISARVSLSTEPQDVWQFTVGVRDEGNPFMFTTVPVTITIGRVGKIRFSQAEYFVVYPESYPVNNTIAVVNATDPLAGSTVVYEIRGDGLARNHFVINNVTGQITLSKAFTEDDSLTSMYTIRVYGYRLNDPSEFDFALVRVQVNRNPNTPIFNHGDLTFTINENVDLDYIIGNVSATDQDSGDNGRIVYFFSQQESQPIYSGDFFYINPSSGIILVIGNLRSDPSTKNYTMFVVAKDSGVPSRQNKVKVTIVVTRNPHAPEFSQTNYEKTIDENVPVKHRVLQIMATDADNDPIVYDIIPSPPATLYFNVDSFTGVITTSRILYREDVDRYIINVRATDQSASPLAGTATVTININRNANPPVFANLSHTVSISEYHDIDTKVIEVTATDNDNINSTSGILRYAIDTVNSYFTITRTTGVILLAQPLTTDLADDVYILTVVASDTSNNPKSASTSVTINVVRNMFAPEFTPTVYQVNATDTDRAGTSLVTVTAADADSQIPLSANTNNAKFAYSVLGNAASFARYIGVSDNGEVYIKQSLYIPNNISPITVQIQACDLSWKPKCSSPSANIVINITYQDTADGQIGFKQPVYYLQLRENIDVDQVILLMDVEYQASQSAQCNILGDLRGLPFSIAPDQFQKNCGLKLIEPGFDYEVTKKYNVTVQVTEGAVGRRKRQIFIQNTHPIATVIIEVLDVNDNSPIFQYEEPHIYPLQTSSAGTENRYFGAIASDARPDASVMRVYATDEDSGLLGLVTYSMDEQSSVPANPPFLLSSVDGTFTTNTEFSSETLAAKTYKIPILATDNAPRIEERKVTQSTAYINIIYTYNRFVLVLRNMIPEDAAAKKAMIRRAIQDEFQKVCIIENIERRRNLLLKDQLSIDGTDSDVIFVLGEPREPYNLINNSRMPEIFTEDKTSNLNTRLQADNTLIIEKIRLPYQDANLYKTLLTKSYVWWIDDPWAALIALAAIIILLCIVGIIVLVFTHSRYTKYINHYRVYQAAYDQPDFMEPPSFLKEYETQSLNMYVPPDEAVGNIDTLNFNIGDNVVVEPQDDDRGISTAAVNPIFQDDNGTTRQGIAMPEGTTML
ncbi:protocadherin Fat 4-like, partial [Ylistrum balloti]|uniref:protocadherin Fat 4-like n=1 Tax=Ylistrum balloti TaxID=509963 RepID=UPI002905E06C